jgi:hypothetical protein
MASSISFSSTDVPRIVQFVEENETALLNGIPNEAIARFFNGKHRQVFELREFPRYVIKVGTATTSETIYKAIEKGHEVIKNCDLPRLRVPHVSKIPFKEDRIIWIEEKLEGIFNALEAQEKSELTFESDREKWIELSEQAATFIIKIGYYDVDWRNLLFMGDAIGFIDFEKIAYNDEDKASGLFYLMKIIPDYCIDPIIKLIRKERLEDKLFVYAHQSDFTYRDLPSFEEKLAYFKEQRHNELERNKKLRAFHTKVLADDAPVSTDGYAEGTIERRIIDRFNQETLTNRSHLAYNQGNKRAVRKMSWQPFLFSRNFNEEKVAFEQALSRLQQDGVIFDFSKPYDSLGNCVIYNIQF